MLVSTSTAEHANVKTTIEIHETSHGRMRFWAKLTDEHGVPHVLFMRGRMRVRMFASQATALKAALEATIELVENAARKGAR